MDNATRLEIYRRDRTELTRAQQRRIARHERRAEHQVVVRASRLRKATERAERRRVQREAVAVINAVRQGWLRPSVQADARRNRALDVLKRAVRR